MAVHTSSQYCRFSVAAAPRLLTCSLAQARVLFACLSVCFIYICVCVCRHIIILLVTQRQPGLTVCLRSLSIAMSVVPILSQSLPYELVRLLLKQSAKRSILHL